MRRRLPGPVGALGDVPVHRHSLLPAGDGRGAGRAGLLPRLPAAVRQRHSRPATRTCSTATIAWSSRSALVVFVRLPARATAVALHGPARVRSRSSRASLVTTIALAALIGLTHPVTVPSPTSGVVTVTAPTGVLVLFFLLMLAARGRRAVPRAPGLRAPAARLPRAPRRALGADRRRRRRRPARPARDPAQPGPGLHAGRLRRRRPAQAAHADRRRSTRARHDRRPAAHPRRGRARRGDDRDPLRARLAARARRARGPRPRHPGAHAADRLRAAAGRAGHASSARCARCSVEDVLGREPVRMEVDRSARYLTGQVVLVTGAGGSIGAELCRQIARVGAAPAHPGRPRRGQPLRDPARARGRPPRPSRRRSRRCSPTARRASGCARSSRPRARPSSSTRPPTSTSG